MTLHERTQRRLAMRRSAGAVDQATPIGDAARSTDAGIRYLRRSIERGTRLARSLVERHGDWSGWMMVAYDRELYIEAIEHRLSMIPPPIRALAKIGPELAR
jgi:hypothetical protein